MNETPAGFDSRRLLNPKKLVLAAAHFFQLLAEFPRDVVRLGWQPAIVLLRVDIEHWLRRIFQRSRLDESPQTCIRLWMRGYSAPFYIRRNTSDRFIVRQVFRQREYDVLASGEIIGRFVDGGANIGSTSFFLLNKYPTSRGIVVEPDVSNMEVCRRNLAPFGDRVHEVCAGIWSSSNHLRLRRPPKGHSLESAISVEECAAGEPGDLLAVTLDDLVERFAPDQVDLVKLDVEGAEETIFSKGSLGWLERTRNLVIELHGPRCEESLRQALDGYDFNESSSGELTVCAGLRRRVPLERPIEPSIGAVHHETKLV